MTKKAFFGTNIHAGPIQTIAIENRLSIKGTPSSALDGPNIITYTSADQFPLNQQLSYSHDNIGLFFDMYYDDVSFKSSYTGSNFGIYKLSNQLQFIYGTGTIPGGIMGTLAVAGYIANTGILTWQKQISANSISFTSPFGIIGTTTNNNAVLGSVGEYITSTQAGLAVTTAIPTNMTSISLTAGDWDVWGTVGFAPTGAPTVFIGGISSTSATLPSPQSGAYMQQVFPFTSGQSQYASVGTTRFSLASTTTIYLILRVDFAAGTCSGRGYIGARRIR